MKAGNANDNVLKASDAGHAEPSDAGRAKPSDAGRADARVQAQVAALTAWRRFLRENRAGAVAAVNAAVKALYEARIFSVVEINQYRSQMLNGAAVPDDFRGGVHAAHSRA